MSEAHVRVALNEEQFRRLVGGEEVVAENPPTGPTVHLILSDIGEAAMFDALDDMHLSPEERTIRLEALAARRATAA